MEDGDLTKLWELSEEVSTEIEKWPGWKRREANKVFVTKMPVNIKKVLENFAIENHGLNIRYEYDEYDVYQNAHLLTFNIKSELSFTMNEIRELALECGVRLNQINFEIDYDFKTFRIIISE